MQGIDTATSQAGIVFSLLTTIQFVVVKAGGSNSGYYEAPFFREQIIEARKAGKKIGAYWFNGADPIVSAEKFAATYQTLPGERAWVDIEHEVNSKGVRVTERWSAIQTKQFVDRYLELTGSLCGIYMSASVTYEDNWQPLVDMGCDLWVAHYDSSDPKVKYWNDWSMHQYEIGTIPGFSGKIDKNVTRENYLAGMFTNYFSSYRITGSWANHVGNPPGTGYSLGGIDYGMPKGTPLRAVADGVVGFNYNNGTGGYTTTLALDNGWKVQYLHNSAFVGAGGRRVSRGEVIAYSGGVPGDVGAGTSTGAHLHIHALTPGGTRVNFLDYIDGDGSGTISAGGSTITPIDTEENELNNTEKVQLSAVNENSNEIRRTIAVVLGASEPKTEAELAYVQRQAAIQENLYEIRKFQGTLLAKIEELGR